MTTLFKDEKSKISQHDDYVLFTHFSNTLSMWKNIDTNVKQILLKDVIERLHEYQCFNVIEYVKSRQEKTLKLLQIRFKFMKNKKRAKLKKQVIEYESLNFSIVSNHVVNLIVCES